MSTEFSHDQYALAYPDGVEHHWWNRARSWIILRLLKLYSRPGDAVMEVGCGRGVEVMSLQRAGMAIHGVELAPVAPLAPVAECVATGMDAKDVSASLRAETRVLLLLDVLEHIPEPASFLRQLLAHYANVTTVIVTVPARQELWSNYDEFYGHQCRYSIESLRALGDEAGLSTVSTGYFFQMLYPPARLLSLLGRDRGLEIRPPSRAMRGLHGLLAGLFQLEHALMPRRVRGSSAYGVFAVET